MNQAIVITSINPPNEVMKTIAADALRFEFDFFVIGDTKSPADFSIEGCRFLGIADQANSGFAYANLAPVRNYARKNIGYLAAMANGAQVIVETDDDNFARQQFFERRVRRLTAPVVSAHGWVNVYRYFSDGNIWPRGLPLDHVRKPIPDFATLEHAEVDCPIQQGLADGDPDVDALYRLLLPLPHNFRTDRIVAFGSGAWVPFNSQNTSWWPSAFPLMYLPSYCNFRVTDIWRSLVAQRIAWANGWHILFHGPTVWQDRNEHDLMKDFEDEIPGYLNNHRIRLMLEDLPINGGLDHINQDVRRCYQALVECELVGAAELPLLDAWTSDLDRILSIG